MGFGEDAVTVLSIRREPSDALRRLHRYNAVFLAGFILLHFATHLSGFWGIEAYNSVQAQLRRIYRFPLIEWAVIVSITVQVVLGGKLLADRLRAKSVTGFWGWLQIVSGAIFLIFMAQHLYSLAMARLYFLLDTNFYWPASVMSGPWFIYYFAPYYFLGVFALFAHIGAGIRFVMVARGARRAGNRTGIAFIVLGFLVASAIPPIIAGALYSIELPQEWIEYLRFYTPGFEPW